MIGINYCETNKVDTMIVEYTPLDFIEVFCRYYVENNMNFYNIMYQTLTKEYISIDEFNICT